MAQKPERLVPTINRNSSAYIAGLNIDVIQTGKTRSSSISSTQAPCIARGDRLSPHILRG
jgi:hypothetical protein